MLLLNQGAIFVGSHARWKYSPTLAKLTAARLADDWDQVSRETGATCVAVQGTSGLCMAILMNTFAEVPFVFVRKPGDTQNSGSVEGDPNTDVSRYLFLDDLIASGDTRRNVRNSLSAPFSNATGIPKYVGTWTYNELTMGLNDLEIIPLDKHTDRWTVSYT